MTKEYRGGPGLPGGQVVAGEHRLELLRHPDRHHPRLAGRLEVGADHVDLAVSLGETDQRDVVDLGELEHRLAERQPDLVEQRRRRHLGATMLTQERDDLTRHLQVRHIRVEIDPVETLHLQGHVTSKQIVDVRDLGHRATPEREDSLGPNVTRRDARPDHRRGHLGGPRLASLGRC